MSNAAASLPSGALSRPILASTRTRVTLSMSRPCSSSKVTTRCTAECPSAGSLASETCSLIRLPIGRPLDCRHNPSSAATDKSLLKRFKVPPLTGRNATALPSMSAAAIGTVARVGATSKVASSAAGAAALQ